MVGTGVLASIVDHCLYRMGVITQRMKVRGSFIMGLLWPLFILLLAGLIWTTTKKR
jgi:hypothetical protein